MKLRVQKHMMKYFCFLLIHFSGNCYAQEIRESGEQIVAELTAAFIENNESTIDYSDLSNQLNSFLQHPLNLNTATQNDFQKLFFLDESSINAIIQHRKLFGDFYTVYELQTIETLNERTIYYLSYFVCVEGNSSADKSTFFQMLQKGKNELAVMHENEFQQREGNSNYRKQQGKEFYLGSPFRYVLRYKFKYSDRLSFGYNGEKDMGEQFFEGAQKYGFDFNSFYAMIKNQGKFKTILVGDYLASFGQGLTFATGLASRKSSYVLNVRRNFETLRPHHSLNESEFLRGASVTYLYKKMELTGLFSYKNISTNFRNGDSLSNAEDAFSSIALSGLHRTANEIQNANNTLQQIYGGHIKYVGNNYDFGVTAVQTFYDRNFLPASKPYMLYNFRGKQLSNFGIDYNFYLGNANFFGEISNSSNGAYAIITGVVKPLDQNLDVVLMYRNYAKNYQTTFNNPFAENNDGRNEEGFYSGIIYKFNQHLVLNSYADLYRSVWLRYLIDAPSNGYDLFSELQFIRSKNSMFYVRYKYESKMHNLSFTDLPLNVVSQNSRENLRLNFTYPIDANITGESRVEFVQYNDAIKGYQSGILMMHEMKMKPARNISINTRIVVFNIEDYLARIYAAENDVLNSYAVPLFQNSGIRFYLLLHYRMNKRFEFWLKYSQTTYNNVSVIGSGLQQINGNILSDLRVQFHWNL